MHPQLELIDLQILVHRRPLFGPLNLRIRPGEVVTLMGASGSGKSSLTLALAGHLQPPLTLRGDIRLDNVSLLPQPAHLRRVGLLFQDDVLFPHLTIVQNLLFALPPSPARQSLVERALAELAMQDLAGRLPAELSGGQRARISVLRTLLSRPQALALDEPFSRLDKPLRRHFRQWVFERITQAGIPALLVTHDDEDIPPGGSVIQLTPHATG